MKKSFTAALMFSALALSSGLATVSAEETASGYHLEGGNLWFVELAGKPSADGNKLDNIRKEKTAFRAAAKAAGISYQELRSFEVLFNGFSVRADGIQRASLAALPGVKAVWPVEVIAAPARPTDGGAAPDLATAISMTRADIVQNDLGFTGAGVRVAVMDTGVDYDHADLGGDGVARENSTQFPNSRVVAGWDFVGDDFDAGLTPLPDPYPDDCGGHGSHVAGIVGANGEVVGVAPDVSFGAYRVFGCVGSTTSDIMLAAMERALADGMNVLNMSIGARAQWPQYPTAAAATRLQKKGMVVVASIGNNGPGGSAPDGPYAAGAPGVGADVIGVASYDNTHVTQPAFSASPDGRLFGYSSAAGAPATPTSGSLPLARTGTPVSANDGCLASQFAGFPAGSAALIRRGTCTFHTKAANAQNAGAAAVVLYNNVAGFLSPTVAGTPAITIPVVMVSATDGVELDSRVAGAGTTITWTDQVTSVLNPTGGLISGFSSFGIAADLTLKPDIGAPGGSIFSTIPLEQGGHGLNSGTSMSAPHVAGAVALLLQADPNIPLSLVRSRLQNSAKPTLWNLAPGFGFLDNVHRQGAGLLDIEAAILATVDVTPGKLTVGESEAGPQTRRLTIRNRGSSAVTFDLSHEEALATGPKKLAPFTYQQVDYWDAFASVDFSAGSVTVPAGASRTVDATITAPTGPDQGQYGGYILLTPQGGGQEYRVPYVGFVGDYQTLPVLNASASAFGNPILRSTPTFGPNGPVTINPNAGEIAWFLVHFDHHLRYYEFRIRDAASGAPVHTAFPNFDQDVYVGRNTTSTGFFGFVWDGTRIHSAGKSGVRKVVPNGEYLIDLRVLKALGDPANPDHWEVWTSPVVTIARP